MRSAIASGNLGTIQSAAAKWRNAQPTEPEEEEKKDDEKKEEKKDDSADI